MGFMVRGPAPLPQIVPSVIANIPVWICFWIASRSTSVSWIALVWSRSFSAAPERVLHRPRHRGVDVGLHRRQVHDVAADHYLGDAHPSAEDAIQHQQLRALGSIRTQRQSGEKLLTVGTS